MPSCFLLNSFCQLQETSLQSKSLMADKNCNREQSVSTFDIVCTTGDSSLTQEKFIPSAWDLEVMRTLDVSLRSSNQPHPAG